MRNLFSSALVGIERVTLEGVSKGGDTAVLGSSIGPSEKHGLLVIQVQVDTASVFKADITRDGNTHTCKLNNGVQLTAGALTEFSVRVHEGDTVNFKCTQAVTYDILTIDEVPVRNT